MNSVLLDSSFLIALSNDARSEHQTAQRYFFEFMERRVQMYLSTIVISEYETRQRITDLGLHNFHIVPFNIDDAITAAQVFSTMHRTRVKSDSRVAVSADAKILGQCINAGIEVFATSDTTCCQRIERIRSEPGLAALPRGLNVRLPFDSSWFENGQKSLDV